MANNSSNEWRERFIKGGWIPPSREALRESLKRKEPGGPKKAYLHPAVQALKHLIDELEDPEVYMGFHHMLAQEAAQPVGPNRCAKF